MKLVDVKLKKETSKNTVAPSQELSTRDKYPWGLRLSFEKEQIDKVPLLKDIKVGTKVIVTAEAIVETVRQSERQNGENSRSAELQITSIAVNLKEVKPPEKMSPQEYREARKRGEI